jgi:hypothetical protein
MFYYYVVEFLNMTSNALNQGLAKYWLWDTYSFCKLLDLPTKYKFEQMAFNSSFQLNFLSLIKCNCSSC